MNEEQTQQQGAPSVDALTAAFTAALKANAPQQQVQQQMPQMTQEELDQHFRTYRIHPQLLDAMFGEAATNETRMAALQHIVQGSVANAVAMSNIMAQHHISQYQQQLDPDLQEVRHLAESRFFDETYDGHPGLKTLEPIIREMLPKFREAEDYPKADRRAQPKYVRDKIIALQKQVDPNFDPTGGQGQQQQQAAPNNVTPFRQSQPHAAPNTMSAGGQGGGGKAGTGGQQSAPVIGMATVGF